VSLAITNSSFVGIKSALILEFTLVIIFSFPLQSFPFSESFSTSRKALLTPKTPLSSLSLFEILSIF
jgi:hypothetical protein